MAFLPIMKGYSGQYDDNGKPYNYGLSTDIRPVCVKSGIMGCVNCNNKKCDHNTGSEYETKQGSDHCINRIFEADDELCDFINSQHN